jgi:acetoin utilization deacetylase AcuC-like enzyme
MIGFSSSPRLVEHLTGPHHPERPDRIRAIHRAVREAGLVSSPDPFPEFKLDTGIKPVAGPKLVELTPTPADEKWILTCHSQSHVDHVKRVCAAGGGVLDQGDTPVGKNSYDIALLSLGSALGCCDAVIGRQVTRAFSAGRPPGHHAEPTRAMGFCLFSNAAIAARYLQRHHGLGRVAIVDFDVHHGNGTQACVEDDDSVLFISLHENPHTCYPGSGHAYEVGDGPGRGFTLNIPMDPGSGDAAYLAAIEGKVLPRLELFRPEAVIISAGFDAHADDPLAHIELTDDCYETMTRKLVGAADQLCDGRVISLLEGGYNLRALGRSAVRHLVGLQ